MGMAQSVSVDYRINELRAQHNTIVVLAAIQKDLLTPQPFDRDHNRATLSGKNTRIDRTCGFKRVIIVQKGLSTLTSFRSTVDRHGLRKTVARDAHCRLKKVFTFKICTIKVCKL